VNKRIKKLALQAMTYVTHNPKANKLNSGDMFDEKFAELIVKECADWIDRQDETRCPYGVDLVEHFGVGK